MKVYEEQDYCRMEKESRSGSKMKAYDTQDYCRREEQEGEQQ